MDKLAQVTRYRVDLDQVTPQRPAKDDLYQGDALANEIALELYRNGESQSMDGCTASGEMTRADGNRVPCEGTVEGHVVTIWLNEHCYVVAGDYELAVTISRDGAKRTLLKLKGTVQARGDGAIVDINETLVDVDAVLELYGSMQEGIKKTEQASKEASEAAAAAEEATRAAQGAAEGANQAAERAEDAAAYIEGATFDAEQLPAGSMPTISTTDEDGHMHATFGIPQGEQGKPYTIKGSAFATLAQLQAGVPDPEEGDLYNVGTAPPYNIYRWTGSAWEDQGKVQGGQGEPGEKGDKPIRGVDYWTEEDKAEIVEEVIESTKGLADDNIDLLWSNINHSTAFAAQVVSLPALADYKIIGIRFKGYIAFTEYSPLILYQADDTRTIGTVVSATTENIFARPVTINKAAQTVTFGSGSKNGDTMAYNDNNFAIPVEIYGVRWGGGGSGGSGGGASDEAVEELEQQIEDIRSIVNQKADVFDDTARGGVLEVNVAIAATAEKLVSYIEPAQEGSGDPLPENIRTITPWVSVTVTNETSGQTLTAELNQPVYGGVLDWTTGVLTIDRQITTIGALNVGHSVTDYQNFTLSGFPDALLVGDDVVTAVSDRFRGLTKNTISSKTDNYLWANPAYPTQIRLKCTAHDMTGAEFKAAFADTQIVYRLAEPYTIQLTHQQMQMLKGQNTLQSNCGDTEVTYFVNTKYYIDKKFAQIAAAILSK